MSKIIKNNIEYANTSDSNVLQTETNVLDTEYSVLLSGNEASNSTEITGTRKDQSFNYNPYFGILTLSSGDEDETRIAPYSVETPSVISSKIYCQQLIVDPEITTTISECFTNSMTSDATITATSFIRVGRSCQLTISLNRKTQCGGGGDICRGYLGSVAMDYVPTVTIRAGSFIGNRAVGTELQASTGLITIRNASSSTISANTGIHISVMWIFDGDFQTI